MPKPIRITVTKKAGTSAQGYARGMRMLGKFRLLVGVPQKDGERQTGDEINNAALAYIHGTGSPSQNIPARPFLEPGIQDQKARIVELMRSAGEAALDGNTSKVEQIFHAIGTVARDSVKSKINTGPFAPLKPLTIAARKRRGRNSDKPLIDTGQLRNSIQYVLQEKETK